MKNTVLTSLLRSAWMIADDALMSSATAIQVQQLIDGDARKYTARPEVLPISMINPAMGYLDDDEESASPTTDASQQGPRVAIVPLHGTMLKYGTLCTYGTTEIAQHIAHLMADPSVIGLVLDIDTPGGEVSSIPPMIEALEQRNKPVLALSDTCCSAGYFAALFTDEIWASNDISAMVGSIGVQVSFADVQPYYEKLGVVFHRITPPESYEKNKAFELAREGKYEQITSEMLSPMAQRFQQEVRAHRPRLLDEAGVLNGKTYLAQKALELGLIDRIGNLQQAVARVSELALQYEAKKFINANQ